MFTQRQHILVALGEHGWRVVSLDDLPGEWWVDSFVELQSSWSPVGTRVVLTFLVDPQHARPRRKGEAVWAVVASAQKPDDRTVDGPTLSLGNGWQQRLEAFVAELEQLRTAERS